MQGRVRAHAIDRAGASAQATFITRVYGHLFGAIALFTFLELFYFASGIAPQIAGALGGVSWLLVLGGFVLVSWMASRVAHTAESVASQYLALAGFVVAESIIFVPLLYVAQTVAPGAIESAAFVTLAGFTGLTAIAFYTRKDFSFLRGALMWGGIVALVAIVAATLFGFQLGVGFMALMVAFAGASVLYDTSNVLHHYPHDRYVAAALELFASIALMLWYVLRLFIASRD